MTSQPGPAVEALVLAATVPRTESDDALPARFALELRPGQDPAELAAAVVELLADFRAQVTALSDLDPQILVLDLLNRALAAARPAACFAAGYALAEQFDLITAEPDLPTAFFPEGPLPDALLGGPLAGFPPGCWVSPEPALESTPEWAIDRMQVPAAWALSVQSGRPPRGHGIVVAQPDTGITAHLELDGVTIVPGFDVIDADRDPTDPLSGGGNPGHGTGTASVLVSPESHVVTGSATRASLMPIRAIETVVRIRQVTVARAIDLATESGAHVVTMSLGGIPAASLHRAIQRAVRADLIVLAAAGNCVRVVVWPARYDECIAVAATNAADQPWPGTSRGAPVDISAPGQNVYRAVVPPSGSPGADTVGQGQGTSFAVALTAGVAALWLAHHGRQAVIDAAHARGETVHAMFRRLLQATAYRPAPWDATAMGPGIVNAHALLAASFDLGLGRAAAQASAAAGDPSQVASLVAEVVDPSAGSAEALDWHRLGPELSTALLRRLSSQPAEASGSDEVSETLARSIDDPRLRAALGLGQT